MPWAGLGVGEPSLEGISENVLPHPPARAELGIRVPLFVCSMFWSSLKKFWLSCLLWVPQRWDGNGGSGMGTGHWDGSGALGWERGTGMGTELWDGYHSAGMGTAALGWVAQQRNGCWGTGMGTGALGWVPGHWDGCCGILNHTSTPPHLRAELCAPALPVPAEPRLALLTQLCCTSQCFVTVLSA